MEHLPGAQVWTWGRALSRGRFSPTEGCSQNDNSGLAKLRWGSSGQGAVKAWRKPGRRQDGTSQEGMAWVHSQDGRNGRPTPSEQGWEVSESKTATAHSPSVPLRTQHRTASLTPQRKRRTSTLTGQERWQWLVRVTEIGEGDTTCPHKPCSGRAPSTSRPAGATTRAENRSAQHGPLPVPAKWPSESAPHAGPRWPLWLQQVRDGLPECSPYRVLPGAEGMAIGVLALSSGQSQGTVSWAKDRAEQRALLT